MRLVFFLHWVFISSPNEILYNLHIHLYLHTRFYTITSYIITPGAFVQFPFRFSLYIFPLCGSSPDAKKKRDTSFAYYWSSQTGPHPGSLACSSIPPPVSSKALPSRHMFIFRAFYRPYLPPIRTSAFTLPDAAQYGASCPPMGDTLRRSLGWVVSMVTVTALLANLAI